MKQNKIHKISIIALVFCLLFTTVASAATVSFSDISKSWAKDYIIKAAELGLVKGYTDGTFGPTKNVTRFDTMLMLSRLHKIDTDLEKQIENKYVPLIKEVTAGKDEGAYTELSKALSLGLLSEDKFRSLYTSGSLKKEASREDVAVFIVKAMCLQKEVEELENKLYTLPFNDSSQILSDYRPYVYLAYEKGIISGDDKKNFNPKNSITRQELAKMVCGAYDYIKENDVKPVFDDFETYVTFKGTIEKITINSIESCIEVNPDNSSQNQMVKVIDGTTVIKINNTVSKLSKLEKGMVVECKISSKDSSAKQIVVDTTVSTIEGKIKSVYFTPPMKLIIVDKNDVEKQYTISSDVIVTLDGKNIEFKNLSKNDLVSVRLVDNVVTQVNSTSRLQTYSGKIKNIQYDIPIKLLVEDSSGKVHTFTYDKEPYVTRNSTSTTFDQLRVSDEVVVKTEYDVLTAVDAKSVATPADSIAVIKEIIIGSSNKIKLEDSNGETKEYKLSNTAKISVLNATSTIYDLRVGYKVSVSFDGAEIISIEADETETSQKIFGKVVYVNNDKKLIMLQVKNNSNENEIVYLSLDAKSVIMTLSGQIKRVSDLVPNTNVICVGSYSGGTFNAVSVIIE